jgi:hypothetical protein
LVILIKSFVSIAAVVGLSLVVEHAGPRVGGILSGYPLGLAIALFFYGFEENPQFAAESAVYALPGLMASQAFVYTYYRASLYFRRWAIGFSSAFAVLGYLLTAWVLHFFRFEIYPAAAIPILSVFFFYYLFRKIPNVAIETRVAINYRIIFLRALCAAFMILIITGVARLVGPRWAGLFSAFPVTLFPLMVIIHFTYEVRPVHSIIKNFPLGIGSLITYALTVFLLYPVLGIYAGTLISFAAATLYLVVFRAVWKKMTSA